MQKRRLHTALGLSEPLTTRYSSEIGRSVPLAKRLCGAVMRRTHM